MKSDEDYFSRNMTYFNVFYVWGKIRVFYRIL